MSDQTREQPAALVYLVECGCSFNCDAGSACDCSVHRQYRIVLTELDAARQRQRELEQIAQGLRDMDWCIGYELTEDNHVALDILRDKAFAVLAQKEQP